MESLILEKDLVIKASNAIIKSAIKATIKDIGILYPSILTWKGDYQHCQIRTKRRPFSEEAIEQLEKKVKSINCLCKDGITRTFKIKKIEAFTAKCRSGARAARCVNVYYSVKDSSEVRSLFQIEYSVN